MEHSKTRSPLIELKNITKTYTNGKEETHVLKGLDLTIYEGEFIMIMGKSGSGKTTLMNIIGFLDQLTSGTYKFREEDVSTLNENQKSEYRNENFGFIFQQFFLIESLNVQQNVELPMVYSGLNSVQEKKEKAESFLELVGISEKLRSKTSELSGGQQQRVSIGRALISKPDIILADEPTGNLDSKASKEIIDLLKISNKKYHQTIIMITHDMNLAKEANRIITLEDGHIVKDEKIK